MKLCTLFNTLHGNVLLPSGTCTICLTLSGSLLCRKVIKYIFFLELQAVVSYTCVDRTDLEQQLQDDTHCLYSQFSYSVKHENIMTMQILYHKKCAASPRESTTTFKYFGLIQHQIILRPPTWITSAPRKNALDCTQRCTLCKIVHGLLYFPP